MTRDVILTGLPRSGTTLATAIVDGLTNALALSEPEDLVQQCHEKADSSSAALHIANYFDSIRDSLARGVPILDRRSSEGALTTNYLSSDKKNSTNSSSIRPYLPKDLASDFVLACKHNALFTALLPELVALGRFRIFAVVRSPYRLLDSWQSVPFPIKRGRLPAGEPFWAELIDASIRSENVAIAQAKIVELFFKRFLSLQPSVSIIRYEDMVADPQLFQRDLGLEASELPRIQTPTLPKRSSLTSDEKRELIRQYCPSVPHFYSEEEFSC